jgi:hypothetical protein
MSSGQHYMQSRSFAPDSEPAHQYRLASQPFFTPILLPQSHIPRNNRGNLGSGSIPPINHSTSHGSMSVMPGISTYPVQTRYDHGYPNSLPVHSMASSRAPVHPVPLNVRTLSHNHTAPQWGPPIMSSVDPVEYVRYPISNFRVCLIILASSTPVFKRGTI